MHDTFNVCINSTDKVGSSTSMYFCVTNPKPVTSRTDGGSIYAGAVSLLNCIKKCQSYKIINCFIQLRKNIAKFAGRINTGPRKFVTISIWSHSLVQASRCILSRWLVFRFGLSSTWYDGISGSSERFLDFRFDSDSWPLVREEHHDSNERSLSFCTCVQVLAPCNYH